MKKNMPLEGLRWSRDSGSALYDTPQTAVLGRAGGAWGAAYWLRPPFLFPTAVSLCTCRRSNEEYCFYTTFERITSGEVPIRVMAEIL